MIFQENILTMKGATYSCKDIEQSLSIQLRTKFIYRTTTDYFNCFPSE